MLITPKLSRTNLSSEGFISVLVVIIGIIILLLIGVIGYIRFKPVNNTTQTAVLSPQDLTNTNIPSQSNLTPSPIVTPITSSNIDTSLTNVNNSLDQSMNQVNSDLKDLNNIDTAQDNLNN